MTRTTWFPWICISILIASPGLMSTAAGLPLQHSTFFGGNDLDRILDLATDTQGNVYVAGYSSSANLPVLPDSWDSTHNGGHDAVVAKFNGGFDITIASLGGSLRSLKQATYLGGSNDDIGGIWVVAGGDILVAGETNSADFPVADDGFSRDFGGCSESWCGDGFITRLSSLSLQALNESFALSKAFESEIDQPGPPGKRRFRRVEQID